MAFCSPAVKTNPLLSFPAEGLADEGGKREWGREGDSVLQVRSETRKDTNAVADELSHTHTPM